MNAIKLYHQDGKPSGVFYCEKCRCVKRTEEEANECCQPYICKHCGKETGRNYWTICHECEALRDAQQEADRFQKAQKLTEWNSWVYDGAEYYESVEHYLETRDDLPIPAYVWACKENRFAIADVSDITDRIEENGYEDFDADDLKGMDDLKAAIEKFNEANKDVVSYEPDYGVAILLNAEATAGCAPPSGSPLVWREVQREPLIYEAEPVPHHCYLLVSHKGLWAMSKMTGQAVKHGSTLSPRPEPMAAALTRAHEDWANGQAH